MKICPICKINPVHNIEKAVKDGETIQYAPEKYYFKQKGWKKVRESYWTCRGCTRPAYKGGMSPREYNNKLIELVNSGELKL